MAEHPFHDVTARRALKAEHGECGTAHVPCVMQAPCLCAGMATRVGSSWIPRNRCGGDAQPDARPWADLSAMEPKAAQAAEHALL